MHYTLTYDGVDVKIEYIDIENSTKDNTAWFIPTFKRCKVVSVYDGDTITIVGEVNNNLYKFNVRMYGIDAPEMKAEPELATISRDYLRSRVLNKVVDISILKYEKWGRLLATIFVDGVSINDELIEKNLAKKYFGVGDKPFKYE